MNHEERMNARKAEREAAALLRVETVAILFKEYGFTPDEAELEYDANSYRVARATEKGTTPAALAAELFNA